MSPGPLFDESGISATTPMWPSGLEPASALSGKRSVGGAPIRLAYARDTDARVIETIPTSCVRAPPHALSSWSTPSMSSVFEALPSPTSCGRSRTLTCWFRPISPEEKHAIKAAAAASWTRGPLPRSCWRKDRGRNFGRSSPSSGRTSCAYDYVLHVHTKKTLFSGAEQVRWRDEIYRALFANAACAAIALALLEENRQIGLYFPETSAHIVYWAHTWLSNIGNGHGLLARLGLPYDGFDDYLDYPVGGMFWARSMPSARC